MENRISDARRNYAEVAGKFTQEDAARFFGVSLSTYQKWEQGQGMMNGAQLRAIAEKYGVTVDYLLMVDNGKSANSEPNRGENLHVLLTESERSLLSLYRSMDPVGRASLIEQAEFLSARHPLNQEVDGIA